MTPIMMECFIDTATQEHIIVFRVSPSFIHEVRDVDRLNHLMNVINMSDSMQARMEAVVELGRLFDETHRRNSGADVIDAVFEVVEEAPQPSARQAMTNDTLARLDRELNR